MFGIEHEGALVGVLGFQPIAATNRKAELGYWLAAASVGRGIMTRALAVLLEYAFDELGLHRVELRAATDNAASRGVAERAGFQLEGVLRQSEWIGERVYDQALYGLLESDWRAQRG